MGKRHAENLRRFVPQARLVAVADPSADRVRAVAAELEVEHAFPRLEDLLERICQFTALSTRLPDDRLRNLG